MVESTTSGSSSDTNGPVCAQLLTQLNTAYQHLAPDAQALVSIFDKFLSLICNFFVVILGNDKMNLMEQI